jgi:hypothetical protein
MSRSLIIRGIHSSPNDISSEWIQHFFADAEIINTAMQIEKITKIPTQSGKDLIKITMLHEEDTAKILSKKTNLFQGDEKWKSIYISRSMPKAERIEKARRRAAWKQQNGSNQSNRQAVSYSSRPRNRDANNQHPLSKNQSLQNNGQLNRQSIYSPTSRYD